MTINYPRPDLVRQLNYLGDSVGGAHNLISLAAKEMLDIASSSTGLSDFGDKLFGDDSWREAYYKMVEGFDQNGELNTVGRLMTRQEFIRLLRTRLLLVDAFKKNPEIADIDIVQPVFIIGNSRTGTTILHELLALDPQLRAPLAWETLHPLPLPEDSADNPLPSRAQLGECEQDIWGNIVPEFNAVHEYSSYIPMECLTMMGLEFTPGLCSTTGRLDEFMAWRSMTDPKPGYKMHRRFLQLLQFQQPQKNGKDYRWLLKSPVHLMTMSTLFEEYPDARVIHTHRDPVKTVASTISTVSTTRYIRSENTDASGLTPNVAFGFQFALEAIYQQRRDGIIPDNQIADLHYSDFMKDAVEAIGKAYPKLELTFSQELSDSMRNYLNNKPQGKHGKHHYSPEDFGLKTEELRENFSKYMNWYGVKENV